MMMARQRGQSTKTRPRHGKAEVAQSRKSGKNLGSRSILGAAYKVEAVKLWNRNDCCGDRLHNLSITVDDKVCEELVMVEQGQTPRWVSCSAAGIQSPYCLRGESPNQNQQWRSWFFAGMHGVRSWQQWFAAQLHGVCVRGGEGLCSSCQHQGYQQEKPPACASHDAQSQDGHGISRSV